MLSSESQHRSLAKLVFILGFHAILAVAVGAAAVEGKGDKSVGNDDVLVGINYFAGWWKPLPNKWNNHPTLGDWRGEFPERFPLLGEYNDQETIDREIVAAAENGVDFFLILWYYNGTDEREPNSRFLNQGLSGFLQSTVADRMSFSIEFCNAAIYQVTSDEEWADCIKTWVQAMRHPSYLRVGGKLVFKVHSGQQFWLQNGSDLQVCERRLSDLRQAVRQAELGEMLIGVGAQVGHPAISCFDFTGTYMEVPLLPQRDENYPYAVLADQIGSIRAGHANDAKAYLPFMAAGWNPRPWPDNRPYFSMPTKEEWLSELKQIKQDLGEMKGLGLPLPDGSHQKAFTIYAWNEFGEGGFVAPTKGAGWMKLKAIREVFGANHRQIEVADSEESFSQ